MFVLSPIITEKNWWKIIAMNILMLFFFNGMDMSDFLWLFLSPNQCFNFNFSTYMERLLLFLDWAERNIA
jgi:hypothetical protein